MDRPTDDSAVRFLSLASHDLRGPLATVRTAANTARERGVRLEVSLPAALAEVQVDPDRLQLVLSGAWAHVLERTHPGATAGLTVRDEPASCALTFWDQGPPLTPEGEAHAFDRRWQALRGRELGSSFRMAVAGALVQAHGGTARVESLNGCTLFALLLPSAGPPA